MWLQIVSHCELECAQRVQTSANVSNVIKTDLEFESGFAYSDLDVSRIDPKMLWIHYLVGITHLSKCHEIGR